MWEFPLGPQQEENVLNNILEQTSKPELSQYLHASLFSPTTSIILREIKRFPEDVAGPHRKNYQETPLEIKEYNNGTPAHEKTSVKTKKR